ncbi:rubredoxin [Silanimonas sp.]|uniref:rubredoxin n=1 Tax=Silanimonas sp. TaxID=1929290 RepID=UPI001BC55371|nr:rubredoxin [Silanimonas sp.]MBS3895802.1 rubredoxin [Silanimonas sp.]
MPESTPFQTWVCVVCGFLYDEARGLPEEGLPPGTRWAEVPADWACPECGVGKDDFEMVAV